MSAADPDVLLVDYLCETVLADYSINRDILLNWQVELTDSIDDAVENYISDEIILTEPLTQFTRATELQVGAWYDKILDSLQQMEDEVYADFKVIVLDILLYVCQLSHALRYHYYQCRLHERFIRYFLLTLQQPSLPALVVCRSSKIVVALLEMGCTVTLLRRLVMPLFAPGAALRESSKLTLLELVNQLYVLYPSQFEMFIFQRFQTPSTILALPFENDVGPLKLLTIQLWFKRQSRTSAQTVPTPLCMVEPETTYSLSTLLVISTSNDMDASSLRVQLLNGKQIRIDLINSHSNSRMQFLFNQQIQYKQQNQGYTHMTLTYDTYKNLNLFIDGEYSESIPCPEIYRVIHTWNKVYIGKDDLLEEANIDIFETGLNIHGADEFLLRQLSILNMSLSPAWINLLYNLGVGFSWDYKELTKENISHLLTQLTFDGFVNFALKLREIRGKPTTQRPTSTSNSRNVAMAWNQSPTRPRNSQLDELIEQLNEGLDSSLMDCSTFVSLLAGDRPQQANVLFDTAGNASLIHTTPRVADGHYIHHRPCSIHTSFFSIGGTSLILRLLECFAKRGSAEGVNNSIQLIFTLINTNWRFAREFEDSCGYGIMLVLINQFKVLSHGPLQPQILKTILTNLGVVTSGVQSDAKISNKVGYRSLVLNDLWPREGGETRILWISHFEEVLKRDGRFWEVNIMELRKMKSLVSFIQILKSLAHHRAVSTPTTPTGEVDRVRTEGNENSFEVKATKVLHLLLCNDSTKQSIRSLSLYAIYAIYHHQKPSLLALKTLTEYLTTSSPQKPLRNFAKSISVHWMLLLIGYDRDEQHASDISYFGLKLLERQLKVLGPVVSKRFFQVNHGVEILSHFLKDCWTNDEVVDLVYQAAFDQEDDTKVLMPEFLIILNNIAIRCVRNLNTQNRRLSSASPRTPKWGNLESPAPFNADARLVSAFDVIHFLNHYLKLLEGGSNDQDSQVHSFYKTKVWLDGTIELLGILKIAMNKGIELSDVRDQLRTTYEIMRANIATIFIGEISRPVRLFKIIGLLNDFTKKLVLETIFPKLFDHANQFLGAVGYDTSLTDYSDGSLEIVRFYLKEFVSQGYAIDPQDLHTFINCSLSVIEYQGGRHNCKTIFDPIGDLIVCDLVNSEGAIEDEAEFEALIITLLNRLVVVLQVLNHSRLIEFLLILIDCFLHLILRSSDLPSENLFNFLRTCYLSKQDDFDHHTAIGDSEIVGFLRILSTQNDSESLKYLQRHATLRHVIARRVQEIRGQADAKNIKLSVLDMTEVIGDNSSRESSVFVEACQRDCQQLKIMIMEGESLKYTRLLQDQLENVQHCVGSYHDIKLEITRLVDLDMFEAFAQYALDYIEGADRMRKRMIVEDQLSEGERLSYSTHVPRKDVSDPHPINSPYRRKHSISSTGSLSAEIKGRNRAVNSNGLNSEEHTSAPMSSNVGALDDIDWEVVEDDTRLLTATDDYEMVEDFPTDRNRKVIRSLYMGDQIVNLWNISQITGLAPIESLMILGKSHLYLIENYFHNPDGGGVIEVADAPASLRDPYLLLVNSQSKGNGIDQPSLMSHRSKTWSLDKLMYVSKRHFLLRDVALELFFNDGASVLITSIASKERDQIYKVLHRIVSNNVTVDPHLPLHLLVSSFTKLFGGGGVHVNHGYKDTNGTPNYNGHTLFKSSDTSSSLGFLSFSNSDSLSNATLKWRRGEISNFLYLMIINTLAGRTFNDLTQYPVFPWIIADYASETLDLSNPNTFRDLSKPMGGQTPVRAEQFKERYEALASLNDHDSSPPFHYGTHYSSAMIVTSYLIRLRPYVHSYLLLQGGKFDHADRLFNSLERAWQSASRDNTTDVRELTPEFFYLPEFLRNSNNFEFGILQNGDSISDVQLPRWAKGDPNLFIELNRQALELPFVSTRLHLWIELVFGHRQSGPEAIKSLNVFHHLSYDGAINLDKIKDETEKRAVIGMINNFGQTPRRIFHKPHPSREIFNIPNYYLTTPSKTSDGDVIYENKARNVPIHRIEFSERASHGCVGRQRFVSCEDDMVVRRANWGLGSLIINNTAFLNVHLADITSLMQVGFKTILAGLEDGIINVLICSSPGQTLDVCGLLRGHTSPVIDLKCSKSYKVAISLDKSGTVLMWDLSRMRFIRKICKERAVSIAISNTSGRVCIVKGDGTLEIKSLNGECLVLKDMMEGFEVTDAITSVGFGNKSSAGKHIYWSTEFIGVCRQSGLVEVIALNCDQGHIELKTVCASGPKMLWKKPTAIEVKQYVELDHEDKLARGVLKVVVGDSTGKVYEW